jgi:hypothetical protein
MVATVMRKCEMKRKKNLKVQVMISNFASFVAMKPATASKLKKSQQPIKL